MTVTAVLELDIRPENAVAAQTILRRVLAETRAFEGCLGIDVFEDPDTANRWVCFERWASAEHDAAYRAFRAGPGAITDLGEHLSAAPKLAIYNHEVDV
ncbi:putative quinol monooxygenase [Rhodococcoides kyotonense]|uniref:Antibiotic biosynthesis monooxygenase n=1 Tax=Rhodococcoides kyotonense TaxID=398843 RepID=A0A177YL65_9NOCA|nr:antibiotic biosynthesis monooxygenase [Rhodococcus kyotonensis]OAK56235.1 antibiotic biosynthesis monooxygenase [Rhodococcus kyotonensis]